MLPLVGILATVLVLIASFAVDLGMQRVARRDMQALADNVALDLARLVDGRTAAQIVAGSPKKLGIEAAKVASENRNEGSALGEDPTVTWTLVTLDLQGDPVRGPDGRPVALSGSAVPQAVLVTAETSVDFAFSAGSGGAARSAVGASSTSACHRLGSFVAALNSGDSAVLSQLNDIMGLNLSLASYQGLADVGVSLSELALAMGAGDVDSLLTGQVSYRDLVQATIDVLNQRKPAGYAAAVTTLRTVLGVSGGIGAVRLGQLLSVSPTDRAALATQLNVLDLLAGSVLVADGTHAVSLPNLQAGRARPRQPLHRPDRHHRGRPAGLRQAELGDRPGPQQPDRRATSAWSSSTSRASTSTPAWSRAPCRPAAGPAPSTSRWATPRRS